MACPSMTWSSPNNGRPARRRRTSWTTSQSARSGRSRRGRNLNKSRRSMSRSMAVAGNTLCVNHPTLGCKRVAAGGRSSPRRGVERTRKRPKELVGTSVPRVPELRTSPQSQIVAGSLARLPCGLRTWFPGPSRGSLLGPVWRSNLPLRARRRLGCGPSTPQRACPRSCRETARSYPRTCCPCGRSVDTLAPGGIRPWLICWRASSLPRTPGRSHWAISTIDG